MRIESYHLTTLIAYCQDKNKAILLNIDNLSREDKNLQRETYKGYIYCIKVSRYILNKKIKLSKREFYTIFKKQIIEVSHNKPLSKVIYEIMNYINNLKG